MFKKLKDKLAEEVKSSPQKFQQFAQAAQAAVTSASSSISDITNNDLFSIGDNDNQQNRQIKNQTPSNQQNTFQDVTLIRPGSSQASTESTDYSPNHDIIENQKQRRLSNSSFASDVSFRLPSYDGPSSMYHLQSDMEISASEAEERSISGGPVSLDRVTKEQLYAAYRRTQERYTKYRTQYADLARHYKLLERENAKAKSVLVETQDKALRRISELREQCSLEQSAKAHLEKALRVEIDDGKTKIEALNTQIQLLQNNTVANYQNNPNENDEVQLINLSNDDNKNIHAESPSEVVLLNCKIEKLEALVNKYKDSLKTTKEKNSQMSTELQVLSNDIESKVKEIEQLQASTKLLTEARKRIQDLNEINEQLQNKLNTYEFNKIKESSTLEIDLQKAQEEISQLQSKIHVFTKREEENAISLAENKLSIHKELESKEAEIKSLKECLTATEKEVQSLKILIDTYKCNVSSLEEERSKLNNEINKLDSLKIKVSELDTQVKDFSHKCLMLENQKSKAEEQYNCLQLQLNQETAEKMAMIDRNAYLEKRNSQLAEENNKTKLQISNVENELHNLAREKDLSSATGKENENLLEELNQWKTKYSGLESEIHEEREELIKLQSEIEKLLANHDFIQKQNDELQNKIFSKDAEVIELQNKVLNINNELIRHNKQTKDLSKLLNVTKDETQLLQTFHNNSYIEVLENINMLLHKIRNFENDTNTNDKLKTLNEDYDNLKNEFNKITSEYSEITRNMSIVQKENEDLKSLIDEQNWSLNKLKTEKQNSIEKQQNLECECKQLQAKIEKDSDTITHITAKLEIALDELNALKHENKELLNKLEEYNKNIVNLQNIIQSKEDTQICVSDNLTKLMRENDIINNKILDVENEKEILSKQVKEIILKVETKEIEITNLQSIISKNKNEQDTACANLVQLEKNKVDMLKNIEEYESENRSLNKQVKDLHDLQVDASKQLDELKSQNLQLLQKFKSFNEYDAVIGRLEHDKEVLIEENLSLKNKYETMGNTYKGLELEINDVRKSHEEMELEKDRLNAVILKLERDQSNANNVTENVKKSSATSYESTHAVTNNNLYDNTMNLESLKKEYDLQKEENRRLNSDIGGLQAYLLKMSKENSDLNDKLRELIVSNENTPEKKDTVSQCLETMHNDIMSEKDKIDDLLRENTLLLEENLELKDQLQTQSYANRSDLKPTSGNELHSIKEKYNKLLEINKKLEMRLNDLEQMNKSVNGSMNQVQQNNDKLRLSNEKLERRLDEALVSLRHLHSLQENTELEYLRNILYEYLTGSGAHSITLAKVLAAVVKFDEMQTQVIMQKEKERQGIMRQLGIL